MAIAKQEAKQIILRPNLMVTLMVMMMNYDSAAGDGNYDEDEDIFLIFFKILIFFKKTQNFGPKGGGTGGQRVVHCDDD